MRLFLIQTGTVPVLPKEAPKAMSQAITNSAKSRRRCMGASTKAVLLIIGGAVIIIFCTWWLMFRVPPRPLLHNVYGRHDLDFRHRWRLGSFAIDEDGNWAMADYERNILFVAVGLGRPEEGYVYDTFRSTPSHAEITFSGPDYHITAQLDAQRDRATFVTRDGTHHVADIAPGEARAVIELYWREGYQPNLLSFLMKPNLFSDGLRKQASNLASDSVPASQNGN